MSWEDKVRKVVPYVPGEQPKINGQKIKLNTNENPYPPAPGVQRAIDAFSADTLRLYPSTTCDELREVLANCYQVDKEQIFVGVGSDDVLANAFLTFFNSELPILFPDITYSFYDVWAQLYRIKYEKKSLDENFKIKIEDYLTQNGGIVIANPNAPTAIYEPIENIEKIIAQNPDVVVIVDEAYIDFGGQSCIPLLQKYDNLLVVQTFSKSRSMAGMRVGYAIGNEKLIGYLNDTKFSINSYTMNQPTLSYAIEAVTDMEYFRSVTDKIIATRTRAEAELHKLGFDMTQSSANFLFVTHKTKPAKEIFTYLRSKNIFVRYFNLPRIDNYLRITVGTDEEMDILFKNLREMGL